MPVRVFIGDHERLHQSAVKFEEDCDDRLRLFDVHGSRVAAYARGTWVGAEVLPSKPEMDAPLSEPVPLSGAGAFPAEAVLEETTDPYVSVSVTSNDADAVVDVWRRCAGAA